jgi:hypothetical protein
MEVHYCSLKRGITRTEEFEKKGLAAYAVNVGTRCGQPSGHARISGGAALRRPRRVALWMQDGPRARASPEESGAVSLRIVADLLDVTWSSASPRGTLLAAR